MTVELWSDLEHGVPRMSDPTNERPGGPQPPPPEAERKSSSPLIWILILIALIAFAWYFYNRNAGSDSIGALAPPAAPSDALTPPPSSPAEGDARKEKNGRAPCRGRGCQAVMIAVVAVAFKNKKIEKSINPT